MNRTGSGGLPRRSVLGALAAALAGEGSARAQERLWPDRPVRLLVGFGAGGVTDVAARLLGGALGSLTGQPFVVENHTGASGVIAAGQVARAAPDGYTLLVPPGTMTILPAIMRNLPLDVLRDLDPITLFVTSPNALVVHPAVPARTLAEFVTLARSRPVEDLAYASSGIGTTVHFFAVRVERATGIRMRHIPYRSSSESITAVVAGDVPVGVSAVNAALPYIQSGAVRAIALGSAHRSRFLPEVPTFAEAGYPEFRSDTWIGLEGPAGMPAPLRARIAALSIRVMGEPAMQQRLAALGAEPMDLGPDGFGDLMRREVGEFRELAVSIGIQPE